MPAKIKFIKYFLLLFSVLGLSVTLFSTFIGNNDYTTEQKIILFLIFTAFFSIGPWLLYKFFSFMIKRNW
jgi:hypothetical protein